MREKRSLDKEHLPSSDYELWLRSQHATSHERRHSAPNPDLYEAWIEARVSKRLQILGKRKSQKR
jgi:hypothetical protein